MDSLILALPHRSGQPDWSDAIEREIARQPNIVIVARASTATAVMAAAREQHAAGRHVVVVCAASLDEGGVVDVVPALQQLGIGVIPVMDPIAAPLAGQLLRAARMPVLIQPGPVGGLATLVHELAAPVRPTSVETPSSSGRILTVAATGGGLGKSFVAGGLAAALGRAYGPEAVVLVDFAGPFGGAEVLAGFETHPGRTLDALMPASDELSRDELALAAPVAPAGYRVLAAPAAPEQAALIEPADAARLLEALRRAFGVVVIDTTNFIDDLFVGAVQTADLVVLVTSPHILPARNLKRLTATLERVGVLPERIGIVVNGMPQRPESHHRAVVARLDAAFSSAVLGRIPRVDRPWVEWLDRGEDAPRPLDGAAGGALGTLADLVARRLGLPVGARARR